MVVDLSSKITFFSIEKAYGVAVSSAKSLGKAHDALNHLKLGSRHGKLDNRPRD